MKSLLRRRSFVSLITLLVMSFNVLAPILSYAVVNNTAQHDSYIVICTSTGTKLVKLDNSVSQTDQGQQQLHSDGNCVLCTLHAPLAAPPTPEFSLKFTQNLAEPRSQWKHESSSTGLKWSPGAARAPPNFL